MGEVMYELKLHHNNLKCLRFINPFNHLIYEGELGFIEPIIIIALGSTALIAL